VITVAIDVGGTFTDVTVVSQAGVHHWKQLSEHEDPAAGVRAALARVGLAEDLTVTHGSTVATNLIVQRRLPAVALVTTKGFRDVLEIGRLSRPAALQYDLLFRRPRPLVERHRRFEVRERITADGDVLEPLEVSDVDEVVTRIRDEGIAAVAVAFLHSYLRADHEEAVERRLHELPNLWVRRSSDVCNERNEFERTSTTVIHAALAPAIDRYLSEMPGPPLLYVMQSNGGLGTVAEARRRPATMALSGPTGGLAAGAAYARLTGAELVITADMGGTSFDVGLVVDGQAAVVHQIDIGGVPLQGTALDLRTIGSGGGSIAWVDDLGVLRVGPRSAGAMPGPACYGHGGTEPTVTDANVVLGIAPDHDALAGGVVLDRERAIAVLRPLAEALGLDVSGVAAGIRTIVNEQMAAAIREITVQRGVDPRECELLVFGGAGPAHGADIAESLAVRRVVVPRAAGVFSTLGFLLSDARVDEVQPTRLSLDDLDATSALHAAVQTVRQRLAASDLSARPATRVSFAADVRYVGQSHPLAVELPAVVVASDVKAAFSAAYEKSYGYVLDDVTVECVAVRGRLTCAVSDVSEEDLLRAPPQPAVERVGPAVVAEDGYTIWVPVGWQLRSTEIGFVIEDGGERDA
jgi:N-methylhydantoinase A